MSPLTESTRLTLAKGQPVPVDLNYSNVSLLLHGNGTNGSTTIVDNSPTPKTVTAVGNTQISTAQSKFGGASIAFDGTGDSLTVSSSSAFGMGVGDFTFEYWIRLNTATGIQVHFDTRISTASELAPEVYSDGTTLYYFTNATNQISAASALTANSWIHISVCRSAGTTKLYVNGNQAGSSYIDTSDYSAVRPLTIGNAFNNLAGLNGYIDDLRITKGVARYTSNFTPPTAPFPDF